MDSGGDRPGDQQRQIEGQPPGQQHGRRGQGGTELALEGGEEGVHKKQFTLHYYDTTTKFYYQRNI